MVASTYLPPRINDRRDDHHSPTPSCQAATRAAAIRLPSSARLSRYQVLDALQATADFARRRGISDPATLRRYFELYLDAIGLGAIDD